MSEENISQVKEMIPDESCCFHDAKPMKIIEETSVSNGHVSLRRYSTGTLDKREPPGGKALVQTRYRGNQTSSTHDLCKHGKRREDDLVIKPWKLVKNKNVECGGGLVKNETLSLVRKSLVSVSKPDKSLHVSKRDPVAAAAASEVVKSCDGVKAKRSETRSGTITPSDSASVRMVKKANVDVKKVSKSSKRSETKSSITPIDSAVGLKMVKKTSVDVKKVSMINESKSSKDDVLKKDKKTKIDEPVRCDDVLEKTLYVVESIIEEKKKSIKSVKSEVKPSPEKKILKGSLKKSLTLLPSLSPSSKQVKEPWVTRTDPRPIREMPLRSKTGLSERKESGSATLVASSKTESKIKLKKIGLKATPSPGLPTRPLSFKKGKVLEPKTEDSTPASIKFKKRVVQEPKLRSDVNKKNLKDKREGFDKSYNIGECKGEKVVLRHRKVETKKNMQTLSNKVIEETVNKLEEEKKSKVRALVGAFETVISLQANDKTYQRKKIQCKPTSSQIC